MRLIVKIRHMSDKFHASGDVEQREAVLDAAKLYVDSYKAKAITAEQRDLGVHIVNRLAELRELGRLREFENDDNLFYNIDALVNMVFRICLSGLPSDLDSVVGLIAGARKTTFESLDTNVLL